jgi:UDP-N-acetylmuramate dehydrogenase
MYRRQQAGESLPRYLAKTCTEPTIHCMAVHGDAERSAWIIAWCTLETMEMKLPIRQNVPLAAYTTMGVGGPARFFYDARSEDEVVAAIAWAKDRGERLFVLGGGSNVLVRDTGFEGLVLRVSPAGVEMRDAATLSAGAGENWDAVVDRAVAMGLAGIECLAGIPGLVGGTPVQNVGAYGQEVAETIEEVRAFDRTKEAFVALSKDACNFRYRESLFNKDEPGRYIVTRVTFRLRTDGVPTLRYAELQRRFADAGTPTLEAVSHAVREIRRGKGMLLVDGDADSRSAGSFFKNPVVPTDVVEHIAASAGLRPDAVPQWPVCEGHVKLPAAWLLEHAGFVKGYGEGAARISTRHTLALTNRGGATCADIERLQDDIVRGVRAKFGVELEREPVLVG